MTADYVQDLESVDEIAAPTLDVPQHAPGPIRPTRVRMEAGHTAAVNRGHHVGLDGVRPSHGRTLSIREREREREILSLSFLSIYANEAIPNFASSVH